MLIEGIFVSFRASASTPLDLNRCSGYWQEPLSVLPSMSIRAGVLLGEEKIATWVPKNRVADVLFTSIAPMVKTDLGF